MINTTEILNAQKHTVFLITLMVTTAIYLYFVKQDPVFKQDKWIKQTIALLIGAVVYDLLLSKIVTLIFNQFNVVNPKIKQALTDIALWSTVFTSLELANSYLDNGVFKISNLAAKERLSMIAVYVLYDLFIEEFIRSKIPNINNNQDLVSDIVKNGLAVYVGTTVATKSYSHFSEVIIVASAFLMYYLFSSNLLLKPSEVVKA